MPRDRRFPKRGLCRHGLLAFDRDTDRPDEADELTGDRGDHVRRGFPPREEAAIATAEALLRFPGEGRDRLGLAALALPVLVIAPRWTWLPLECSLGTVPL